MWPFVQTLLKFMATHAAYSWGFCFLMHEPQTTCFKKCKVHHLHKQSQFLSLEESLTFSGACWILIPHEVPASWGTSPGWFRKPTSLPVWRMYSTFCSQSITSLWASNVFECHAVLFLDFLRFLRVALRMKKCEYFWRIWIFFSSNMNGLHTIGLELKNVIGSNHRLFVVGPNEIWCNLYKLLEVTYFELFDLIKWSFVKESWCHVWLSLEFD
jgi:hypothetical protein